MSGKVRKPRTPEQKAARSVKDKNDREARTQEQRDADNAYHRQWSSENKDKVSGYSKRWAKNNPDKVRARQIKNQSKTNERARTKYHSDIDAARANALTRYYKDHERSKARARKNARASYPTTGRNNRLLYKFGITTEQWNEIFEWQGRVCKCCDSPTPRSKKGWVLDHSHSTNQIRGILCWICNIRLGQLGDCADDVVLECRRFLHYLSESGDVPSECFDDVSQKAAA